MTTDDAALPPGATCVPRHLDPKTASALVAAVDALPWSAELDTRKNAAL